MTIGENYQFYAQLSIRNSTITNPSIGDQYELIMSNKLLDIKKQYPNRLSRVFVSKLRNR